MAKPRWTQEDLYLISQRAWEFLMQGRYAEAGVLLEGLCAMGPSNPWLGRALALVHLRLEQPQRALSGLAELHDIASRRLRFEALIALGRVQDAASEFATMRSQLDPPAVRRCALLIEATRSPAVR